MKRSQHTFLYIIMIIAMISWGLSWTNGKILGTYTTIPILMVWRFFFAALSMLIVLLVRKTPLKNNKARGSSRPGQCGIAGSLQPFLFYWYITWFCRGRRCTGHYTKFCINLCPLIHSKVQNTTRACNDWSDPGYTGRHYTDQHLATGVVSSASEWQSILCHVCFYMGLSYPDIIKYQQTYEHINL